MIVYVLAKCRSVLVEIYELPYTVLFEWYFVDIIIQVATMNLSGMLE